MPTNDTKACLQCAALFERGCRSQARWAKRKYCSQRCFQVASTTRVTVVCEQCGAATLHRASQLKLAKHVFCSSRCSGQFHAPFRRKQPKLERLKSKRHEANRVRYLEFRLSLLQRGRDDYKALRVAALTKLGNKCVRCGFCDTRALQFDHVFGGGYKQRKTMRTKDTLKDVLSDTSGKYQILCANCNQIKKVENNETKPHIQFHETEQASLALQ